MASKTKLLPLQSKFIKEFNKDENPITVLFSELKFDTTITISNLFKNLIHNKPNSRLILLCPSALCSMWKEALNNQGLDASIIDIYKFREMIDISLNEAVWPLGFIGISSLDFAKQDIFQKSLLEYQWDITVFDEAHSLTKSSREAKFFSQIKLKSNRLILLTHLEIQIPLDENVKFVKWTNDKPFNKSRPAIYANTYSYGKPEIELLEQISKINSAIKSLTKNDEIDETNIQFLSTLFYSSPAALGKFIQNLTSGMKQGYWASFGKTLAWGSGFFTGLAFIGSGVGVAILGYMTGKKLIQYLGTTNSEETTNSKETIYSGGLMADIFDLLDQVENIQFDSKLSSMGKIVNKIFIKSKIKKNIILIAQFPETINYLSLYLDDQNLEYYQILSNTEKLEQENYINKITEGNSFLIGTLGDVMNLQILTEVNELILYDVPTDLRDLELLIGRFDRFGRTKKLKIHYIREINDQNSINSVEYFKNNSSSYEVIN